MGAGWRKIVTVCKAVGGATKAADCWLVLVLDLLERELLEDEEDDDEDDRLLPKPESSRNERLSEWKCSSLE